MRRSRGAGLHRFLLGRVGGGTGRSADGDVHGFGEGQVLPVLKHRLGGHQAGGRRHGAFGAGWLGGAGHGRQLGLHEPQGGGDGWQRGVEGSGLETHEGVFTEQDVLDLVVALAQVLGVGSG